MFARIYVSILIPLFREGGVGQQARDALLLCMTLSAENKKVAEYIISTNFCPVSISHSIS